MTPRGKPQLRPCTLVLLSGGLDSVAALHLALDSGDEIAAVGFMYGQRHADSELTAAQRIAKRNGVPYTILHIAEAVRGLSALRAASPGTGVAGVSNANLAGRNAVLISCAAAFAAKIWGTRESVTLSVGATADDFAAFPDCRNMFFEAASAMVGASMTGILGHVCVRAPWLHKRKAEVLAWARAHHAAWDDVRKSVSCYDADAVLARTRCNACDACALRASAFAAIGEEDWSGNTPPMTGGDPSRMAR